MTDISFWLIMISIMDNFRHLGVVVLFISAIAFVLSGIIFMMTSGMDTRSDENANKVVRSLFKPIIFCLVLFSSILVALPDKNTLHIVLGIETSNKALEYVSQNEETKMLFENTVKVLNKKIQEQLEPIPENAKK